VQKFGEYEERKLFALHYRPFVEGLVDDPTFQDDTFYLMRASLMVSNARRCWELRSGHAPVLRHLELHTSTR
jgi:hypothetical protein